jgi:hypothetical protein
MRETLRLVGLLALGVLPWLLFALAVMGKLGGAHGFGP